MPLTPTPTPTLGRLVFCVGGIYCFFLVWGFLQERLSSSAYGALGQRFTHFQFLSLLQSAFSAAISFAFLAFNQRVTTPPLGLLFRYALLSVCSCLSSACGYSSIGRLSYPCVILGKSCKLVPVVLVSTLLHRKRFPFATYLMVLLVSAGVSGFLYFGSSQGSQKSRPIDPIGVSLLLGNLFLDGLINSMQESVFRGFSASSFHMMFFMNAISGVLLFGWQFLGGSVVKEAAAFLQSNPRVLLDALLFCVCGALGQCFVFLTLEQFGALTLVTVTVTRKLFTILLSLLFFEHSIGLGQWCCVLCVFAALVGEALEKRLRGK